MIITALSNEQISIKLKEIYGDKVYLYDFNSRDDAIEYINNINLQEENFLITKEDLAGDVSFEEYIRSISGRVRVIVIVNKLDEEKRRFLFSYGIFDIIEGNVVDIEKIKELIESKQRIIYKKDIQDNVNCTYNVSKNIIIPKETISIYGTSGAGKSFISTIISKKLSEILNINIALLDMDIQNPSIDILANIQGESNMLSKIVDSVDKRDEILDVVKDYLIKDKSNKNLSYLTSNVSLYECQNKLSNKYYEKIYSSVFKNYDYMLIDLPSSPFLDVVPYSLLASTKIFFILNANYISIRQAIKYLDLINKLLNIPKEKIAIIVNKYKKSSLDISQIQSLIPDYNIVATINYSDQVESYINGEINDININFNINKILNWLNIGNIDKSKGLMSKSNLLKKVMVIRNDC